MDCTFITQKGKFNYRVGAIIKNGRKLLMARNPNEKRVFYYSVGGRVKFGETAQQAIIRELKEETSLDCKIQSLYCIHENFFTDDDGVFFHEISLFYIVETTQEILSIKDGTKTGNGPSGEYLEWIDIDSSDNISIYPEFFKTSDLDDESELKHFLSKQILFNISQFIKKCKFDGFFIHLSDGVSAFSIATKLFDIIEFIFMIICLDYIVNDCYNIYIFDEWLLSVSADKMYLVE